MKIGKDQVLCIQKYTEKYRNTVKTGLIYTTVSKIVEKNYSQEQKGTKNQEIYLTNLTKFVKETFPESTENTGEDTTVENHPKKRRFFFGGMFDEVEILRKDVLDIEGCCYFNDRLFYEVQSNIFNGFGDLKVPELILTGVFFGIIVDMILNFWIIMNLILMITICQMIIRLKLLLFLKGCISL